LRDKTNFKAGEPILATVHVKNLTNSPINYLVNTVPTLGEPLELLILNKTGKAVECTNSRFACFIPSQKKQVVQEQQRVHHFYLPRQFPLPPDTYTVQARLNCTNEITHTPFTISSGIIEFQILDQTNKSSSHP